MGKRLAVAGYQNTGKSYPRRWIPDGENVVLLQPSSKFPYLFTGPQNAHTLTPQELDAAIHVGTRKVIGDFDLISPEGKFQTLAEAYRNLPDNMKSVILPGDNADAVKMYDVIRTLNTYKPTGYFKPEHIKGNVFTCPSFKILKEVQAFVNKHMTWTHTIILPDFTHFITEVITSETFLNQNNGGQAFQRYLTLAADGFKSFIRESDNLRKELVVVTEYHVEFIEGANHYELFVPGGRMVKEKFLPSSYYDIFLFTDVDYVNMADDAEPEYRYVTRRTRKYPEARSMGLFPDLYIPNNLQEALTAFRKHYNIPVQYATSVKKVA